MPQLELILRHTLIVYVVEIGVLGLLVFGGIRYVLHNGPHSEGMGVLVCILCILICALLIKSVIPFSLDYLSNDLCVVQGIYENKVGNSSSSGSSGLGFYAIRITTYDQEIIDLTTVPLAKDYFPVGIYSVKAYYTQRSQMLVYIELLEDSMKNSY